MEIIGQVSSILGLILSSLTLLSILTKTGRTLIKKVIQPDVETLKKNNIAIQDKLGDIDVALERSIKNSIDKKEFDDMVQLLEAHSIDIEVVKDGIREQMRDNIKNIYYDYHVEKKIPLYERKTADSMYTLYHDGFGGNTYLTLLYDEICKWEIDAADDRIDDL